jgi:serine/threonine protein kinase
MGLLIVCQACGKRLTIPERLYAARVRGRVVNVVCKGCGGTVRVDGTVPPPPAAPVGESAAAGEGPEIPNTAPLPDEEWDEQSFRTAPPPGEPRGRDQELISHADGPISARGPAARIGRYALFEQFATGGMATVHFGRLDGAGGFSRVVAIKRLLPHLVENREFTHMLLSEARLAARVRHPNVVPTLDVVASKGDVLLVLEYVPGEALSTLCRTQAKQRKAFIPLEIAVSVMHDVLQGLNAVHAATDERGRPLGLVHRDVSPPNVIVGADGHARVLDFGIAKALKHVEEAMPDQLKGKSGYMAPEQLKGEPTTQRSDVFSAGIILWELLALRRLFAGDAGAERMKTILAGDYPPPSRYRSDLPPGLDEVVMRAIAADPAERFQDMREFSEALEHVTQGASARRVADWVQDLARDALAGRARMVAQVENWRDGADEIPLSSSPFSAELTLAALAAPPNFPRIVEAQPSGAPGSARAASSPALAVSAANPISSAKIVILALIAVVLVLGYVALR